MCLDIDPCGSPGARAEALECDRSSMLMVTSVEDVFASRRLALWVDKEAIDQVHRQPVNSVANLLFPYTMEIAQIRSVRGNVLLVPEPA